MRDIVRLLRQGYTDSEIKKILRPEIKVMFNPGDFADIKEYRRRIEKESYNRISAARKQIKEEKKKEKSVILERKIMKKTEPIKDEGYCTYMMIGGEKIKIKVAA